MLIAFALGQHHDRIQCALQIRGAAALGKAPSSEADGGEVASRHARPHANGGLHHAGSSSSVSSAPAAISSPAPEAGSGRSGAGKHGPVSLPTPATGVAAGLATAAPALPSSGPSKAAPAESTAAAGPKLPQ